MRLIAPEDLREKGITFERSYLFRLIKAGRFPKPVKIGERRIAFIEAEIDAFIQARIAERDAAHEELA